MKSNAMDRLLADRRARGRNVVEFFTERDGKVYVNLAQVEVVTHRSEGLMEVTFASGRTLIVRAEWLHPEGVPDRDMIDNSPGLYETRSVTERCVTGGAV